MKEKQIKRTRQEVIEWLKENHLYYKVQQKLPIPVEKHPYEDVDLEDFFTSAFKWKYTSEGQEYWHEVNRRYVAWFNGKEAVDECEE